MRGWVGLIVAVGILFGTAARADATSERPSITDWLVQLGKESYAQHQFEEALGYFNKVLLLQPDHVEARAYIKSLIGVQAAQSVPPPSAIPRAVVMDQTVKDLETTSSVLSMVKRENGVSVLRPARSSH